MSTLNRKHLWVKADIRRGTLEDADTGEVLSCFRGNDLAVHVAFFNGQTLMAISNVTQAVLTVKDPADVVGDPLLYKAQATLDGTLTAALWNARASQHALFEFTGAETNVDISGAIFKDLYMGVNVDTDDSPGKDLCYGVATLRVVEDGRGDGDNAPTVPAEYYTKDQADARYPLRGQGEYTVSGGSELRTLTADSSIDDRNDVLMTLISDLKETGVIQ